MESWDPYASTVGCGQAPGANANPLCSFGTLLAPNEVEATSVETTEVTTGHRPAAEWGISGISGISGSRFGVHPKSETAKPRTVSGANSLRGVSAGFSAKPIRRKPRAGGVTGTPEIVDDSDAPISGKGFRVFPPHLFALLPALQAFRRTPARCALPVRRAAVAFESWT
jgi:hypothetical protein